MQEDLQQKIDQLSNEVENLQKKVKTIQNSRKDQLSIACVSGDMDKILATMIISLAAAAMDTKVKIFFSFWALSALRDTKKEIRKVKTSSTKMFGFYADQKVRTTLVCQR